MDTPATHLLYFGTVALTVEKEIKKEKRRKSKEKERTIGPQVSKSMCACMVL